MPRAAREISFPLVLVGIWILATNVSVQGQTVIGSKHDLSNPSSPPSDRVCVFCHTPHGANLDVAGSGPLWNRFVDLNQVFTLYGSSTMNTVPGQPTGTVSMICLGCHDGTSATTVVNSITGNTKHDLINAPGSGGTPDMTSDPNCRRCHGEMFGDPPMFHPGENSDLTNDHPRRHDLPDGRPRS